MNSLVAQVAVTVSAWAVPVIAGRFISGSPK